MSGCLGVVFAVLDFAERCCLLAHEEVCVYYNVFMKRGCIGSIVHCTIHDRADAWSFAMKTWVERVDVYGRVVMKCCHSTEIINFFLSQGDWCSGEKLVG